MLKIVFPNRQLDFFKAMRLKESIGRREDHIVISVSFELGLNIFDQSPRRTAAVVADAVEEATNGYAYETFWVGKCVPPPRPEDMWCAEDWLEHVSVQDSYSGEWAEDWDGSTRVQRNELEQEVRSVLAAWLDRHNLRPKFE